MSKILFNQKTAIYTRVSTEEQVKEGISLKAQEERLIAYCKAKDLEVYKIYSDEGYSAGSLKRPMIQQLLTDAKEHKFSNVLVYKIDRFSRNLKDLITILEELKSENINFISATEPIDTTSAIGNAFMQIIGVFAELERGMVAERVKLAFDKKINSKEYVARPPLGFRISNKKLEINEEEAKKVREIFNDRIHGISYMETCKRLNIPKSTYYHILQNTIYIGILKYSNRILRLDLDSIIDIPTFYKAHKNNARFLEAIIS